MTKRKVEYDHEGNLIDPSVEFQVEFEPGADDEPQERLVDVGGRYGGKLTVEELVARYQELVGLCRNGRKAFDSAPGDAESERDAMVESFYDPWGDTADEWGLDAG